MKKQLFYTLCRNGESYEARPEYGYKKEITAEDGQQFEIYIHRRGQCWVATEASSGILCVLGNPTINDIINTATKQASRILNQLQTPAIKHFKTIFESLPRVQP